MKKKFLRGIAAFLAVVMMLPIAAFAEDTATPTDPAQEVQTAANEDPVMPLDSDEGEQEQEFEITCDDALKVWTNGGKTIQLKVDGYSDIVWQSSDKNTASVSNGVVTGHAAGSVTIYAYYADKSASCTVTVAERAVESISVSGTPKLEYIEGELFSIGSATVVALYNDGKSEAVTGYTVKPSGILAQEDTSVTITYEGKSCTVSGIKVTADSVTGIEIVSPANGSKYTVGDTIKRSDVSIKVTRSGGDKYTISAADYSDITFSPSGALTASDKTLTVTYAGKSDTIAIAVAEKAAKTITDVKVYTSPTKTLYNTNDTLDLTGLVLAVKYSDSTNNQYVTKTYASNSSKIVANISKLTKEGTQTITLTYTDEFGSGTATFDVTVGTVANITGLDKDEDEYELKDEDDIELKVGDKLNDDVMWYDIFEEVHIIVDGKNKLIDSKSDLNDYPGVELLLKVYSKSSNATTIEAKDIDSDGKVRLQLYVKNGSTSITNTSYSIREYIPVTEAECTVSIYSSKTSTTSTYLKSTKTFSDFEDALAALKDEDELEDVFGVTLGTNYAIRIKFGEDQVLGSSYEFEPDYENPITIDLNGYELKLPSDWIVYDDCEDLVVTITNNNDDEDGSLVYRDKSVTLTVAEGSELEFSEDNIPMDSDAECTVSIYKNSSYTSSSYLIKTKVYETLKEALQDLEDHDEAMETFDIDEDYEDTFAVRMKLGEDQDLGTYTFAPDYDTTITIDLNGYELELESDWIDYEDCEDLVVKIDNNNTSKKGTLKYGDMTSTTISLSSSDAVLTFEEDKIPGLYTVTIGSVTNGTVTASPNKTTVGKGSTVTFTITPSEGYVIDTVKSGTKTITTSTSGYTVSSKGVGTYKLENIAADVKLDVTFKKGSSSTSSSTSSSSSAAANWTNPFTDVSKNAQYYDAVAFVCSEGLFNGMTATKFEPTTTMTRAMFVTVLGRLAGVDVMKYSGTSFTDVSKTDQQISWAAPYIEWAVQVGLTNGTGGGKFSPNDPITHQQMYLFMYRYAMSIENITTPLTGVSLSGISDAGQIADWAEDGVKFASKNGILITSGGKLTPTENALRCELAMLLHGFCTKVLGK